MECRCACILAIFGLAQGARREVGRNATLEVAGLADIKDLAPEIHHHINAACAGQLAQKVASEREMTEIDCGFLAVDPLAK